MENNNMNDGGVQGANGNVAQPNMGPNGMGSMSQQMRPPKPPMDPAKKKKLILGIVLGVVGVIVIVVAIILIVMLTKVNYGESYRVAKELKPRISQINNNYDCSNVIDYVNLAYTSDNSYSEYVNGCLEATDGVEDLVKKLGQTAGVKRDKEIREQFSRVDEAVSAVLPNKEELKQRLNLYQSWHKFIVAIDDLSARNSSDAEIQNSVKPLTESGNEILVTYGEGWLEKTMAYVQAYRAYYNASYSASNKSELRTTMEDAETTLKTWKAENRPDIEEIGGLSFENTSKMATEFTKLYEMIVTRYEENYDEASNDCTMFLGEVFCD